MRTLRLTQTTTSPSRYQVEVALEGEGTRRAATVDFPFQLDARDQERVRWYLEDYAHYPIDPAPEIAARIEQRFAELGHNLFHAVFRASFDVTQLWVRAEPHLAESRIEVATTVEGATALPWELLRDPSTDTPLALRAGAFVRTHSGPARLLEPPEEAPDTLRILLVICRPGRGQDVPFRSVASQLVRLFPTARAAFQLDVLRPPTFARLGTVLRDAKARGAPYQVVHFDGHGTWADLSQLAGRGGPGRMDPLRYAGGRAGAHGYLLFEQPENPGNMEFVDGPKLGDLLAETDVPVLVLNACRSAHAELTTSPDDAAAEDDAPDPSGQVVAIRGEPQVEDAHGRVRAYGSLAQEVVDAGVAGVVAMRYVVYVATAAQFVGQLYASLLAGQELGVAVSRGRKYLADQPDREIGLKRVSLQDWPVPVVYQAGQVTLAPTTTGEQQIVLDAEGAGRERRQVEQGVPAGPDMGFFGRDETLLALDRAFDTQQLVLLHAWAGAGKTTTAVEFARWYQHTGGLDFQDDDGPVLFTSFQQYTPLARVLDQVGRTFQLELEANHIQWLNRDDTQRRSLALRLLKQIPVLWVWDNVEPVAGFPTSIPSAWTDDEQEDLLGFLRQLRGTRAKVLLTSRRDEQAWLGDLPRRVQLPAMPMSERVQLARAVADRHGQPLTGTEDWRALLEFTQGNPLTVTVLVGQALREGVRTREQVEAFVERLRAGEAEIADEEQLGRSASLSASLGYGFSQAFGEAEQAQLALLHLFQGFVNVDTLRRLGDPEAIDEPVPEVRDLTPEAWIGLLDRAAEVGLLTAYGDGMYGIHPALPWYFQRLFDAAYGPADGHPARRATRAYTTLFGLVGNYFYREYGHGRRQVIGVLTAEEANLLQARRLARDHGWWELVIGPMQGLRALYEHTGRTAEWARLVEELVPDLVDPANGGPRPGREDQWTILTDYRFNLAYAARDFAEAERLQRAAVAFDRARATPALIRAPEALDDAQRHQIRTLAVSIQGLGNVLREQGRADGVTHLEEALKLYQRLGASQEQGVTAFQLGHAYLVLPAVRNLDQAESWYEQSLNLFDKRDNLVRARSFYQLGLVAWLRFQDALKASASDAELHSHLRAAEGATRQALDLCPANAVTDLAAIHAQLGNLYGKAADPGALETALDHYQQAIRSYEAAGDRYGAAQSRFNVAVTLEEAGRLEDARLWARSALGNYQTFGDRAADKIEETRELLADIEVGIAQGGGLEGS